MHTVSDALALGLFGGSSKLIVIAAAVVVVLAIVVVFFMVLRSDSGESKTSRGLAFDPDEGPAGAFGGPGSRQNAPGSDWNGAAQRGFGNEALHRPGDFGGTVGSAGGAPSMPQQPMSSGWGGQGAPAWGQQDQAPAWGQPAEQPPAWGQAPARPAPVGQGQQAGWGQPMQGPPSRPNQPAQDPSGWGDQGQAGWNGQRPAAGGAPGWDAAPQQPAWNAPQGPQAPQNNAWGGPAMSPPQQAPNAGWGAPPQQGPAAGWNGQAPAQQPGGWGGAPQSDNAGWGAPPAGQPNAPAAGAGPRSEARIAYIIIREGKEPGRTFEMRKDRMSIGRSRESDIFLEDLAVSRLHASIYRDDQGSYILRDENSANGTTVNGQRVNEHRLNEGDEIQVGQTTMTFTRR